MVPDTDSEKQSKPALDQSAVNSQDLGQLLVQASDQDNSSVHGDHSNHVPGREVVADETDGSDDIDDMQGEEGEEVDALSDAEAPSSYSDDSSEDMEDSDEDSDSALSEVETNEPHEVKPVTLPEELADLTAGREDAVDDDEVVQAILRAREIHRKHPPSIEIEDGVASLSFHPEQPIIAIGTFCGDVSIYGYNNEACEIKNTHEVHLKAIRNVEFSKSGQHLVTTSKDKSIHVSDVETGKLKNVWDQAHSSPLVSLYLLDENRFCTGCEEGYVKMWDTRQKDSIFSYQVMLDVVSAIVSTTEKRHIAVASGGVLTSINLNANKLHAQSEEYQHDFTCLGVVRQNTKLIAGTSKGDMLVFNWGEIGLHSDLVSGFKQPVNCLLPVSETCVVSGWNDGKIRGTHLFPHQTLGVVGQHSTTVESLDISHDGVLIASAAGAGSHVKFWNIKYFEAMKIFCVKQNKQLKKKEHNLPSSNVRNAAEFFGDMA